MTSMVQRYDRWGYGFGSDGYLYDFVKKRSQDKRAADYPRYPNYSSGVWGVGSGASQQEIKRR